MAESLFYIYIYIYIYLLHETLNIWMVVDKLLDNEDFATMWKKWAAVRSSYCRGVYRRQRGKTK